MVSNLIELETMSKVASGHRAFQNSTPVQSRFLAAKWDKSMYVNHRQRLSEVKPSIDTTIPYSYALKLGEVTVVACKKTREKDEKIENIDNENKRLLEKMGDIGDRKIKTKITSQPKRFSTHLNYAHSQEMKRVNKENHRLLQKICTNEPMYSNRVFNKDYDKSRSFQGNITRYPSVKVVGSVVGLKNNGHDKSLLEVITK